MSNNSLLNHYEETLTWNRNLNKTSLFNFKCSQTEGVQNFHTVVSQGLCWGKREVKRKSQVLKKVIFPKSGKLLKKKALFFSFFWNLRILLEILAFEFLLKFTRNTFLKYSWENCWKKLLGKWYKNFPKGWSRFLTFQTGIVQISRTQKWA